MKDWQKQVLKMTEGEELPSVFTDKNKNGMEVSRENPKRVRQLLDGLINNEKVSRWDVMPYRKELKAALKDKTEALERLESLIESALYS